MEFRDPRRIVRVRSTHRAPNQSWDDLDFNVYTNQKWGELSKSHAADILVHYPDGHTTKGLEAHIAELKPQFVFAPDTRIKVHAVRIGSGEWTSVIGVMASWMKSTCSGTTAPS